VLYVLAIVAFSVSMNVHRLEQVETEGAFAFAARSVVVTYRMGTLGDFDESTFENSPPLYLLFVLCTLLVTVILLNVLIAVVSDTFDKIQEVQEYSRVKGMAQAVYDIEATFGAYTCPSYIFFSHCAGGKDEWSGRVAAITSALSSRCTETERNIDGRCTAIEKAVKLVDTKMVETDAKFDAKLSALDTKMVALDTKMVALDTKMVEMDAKFDANFAVLLEKLDQR